MGQIGREICCSLVERCQPQLVEEEGTWYAQQKAVVGSQCREFFMYAQRVSGASVAQRQKCACRFTFSQVRPPARPAHVAVPVPRE